MIFIFVSLKTLFFQFIQGFALTIQALFFLAFELLGQSSALTIQALFFLQFSKVKNYPHSIRNTLNKVTYIIQSLC